MKKATKKPAPMLIDRSAIVDIINVLEGIHVGDLTYAEKRILELATKVIGLKVTYDKYSCVYIKGL